MTNKISGWILLVLGVAIMLYGIYSSFNIFTNRTPVPEIFPVIQKEQQKTTGAGQDLQAQTEEMIRKQITGIIPVDFLPRLFNLISWSLLAGILIFGGSQIANLGIKLIKN